SFRHELARRAVADAMPRDETARLNRDALRLLSRPPAVDWPRLARHAVAAGDPALIVELTIPAAREAAAFGAHREAATFYRAAVEHLDRLAPGDRGDMLERFAHEALVTGDVPDALAAQEQALTTWRSLGDRVREGRCLVELDGSLWLSGTGDLALATARAAAEQLAVAAPDSAELARALSVLAQRLAVAGADDRSAEEVAS